MSGQISKTTSVRPCRNQAAVTQGLSSERVIGSASSPNELLSVKDAAASLGIKPTTLYDWLGQSDRGILVIRGEKVTIRYYQGGPSGQGRILIEYSELMRILELMRVHPQPLPTRRLPSKPARYPGVTVPLGRPRL